VVRSRLLRAVDALDTRRHQVTEIGAQAKEVAPKVGLSLLGIAMFSAASVLGLRAYATRKRRERRFVWVRERQPSFVVRALQQIAMTTLTVIVAETTRRSVKNVIDGRYPDGRLAVGRALEAHQQR
jgi:hypothetical protein